MLGTEVTYFFTNEFPSVNIVIILRSQVASIESPLVAGSAVQCTGAAASSRGVLAACIGTGVASRLEG